MNQPTVSTRRHWLLAAAGASLAGCASFSGAEPLKVAVVDIESLNGEGMEVRMMVKLRVQNPTDSTIEFDGATLDLDLRGMSFASGVSAESGRIPRFGELIVSVPVTISAGALIRQALSLARERNAQRVRIDYAARGRLAGGMLGGHRFESSGQLDWPPAPAQAAAQ
jgi:LEA14-like dessication related protein